MKEKLIDEYVEQATKDVPRERREDVRKDMTIRIRAKVIDTASAKKSLVNDEVVAEVLRQWPPYRSLKGIKAPAPAKISVSNDMKRALLPLVGLLVAFVLMDAAFLLLVPDAAGTDSTAILLAIVFAPVTAILVIGAIFAAMYLFTTIT
jgi:hypothetical protein